MHFKHLCMCVLLAPVLLITSTRGDHYYDDSHEGDFEGLPYAPLPPPPPPPPHFVHHRRSYRYPFPPQPQYSHGLSSNRKQAIQALIPVSPVYDVEVMRPMAQLQERKPITLYIVPQSSLNVVPNIYKKNPIDISPSILGKYQSGLPLVTSITTNPGHIPAIEVPLAKPLVISVSQLKVLAPAGFTVLFKGPLGSPLTYPVLTGALLAPVPAGTIISPETPVVLTTIYAVPTLPALPGSIKILAEVSRPATSTAPAKVRPIYPLGLNSGLGFSLNINPFQLTGVSTITNGYGHGTLASFPFGFQDLQASSIVSSGPVKQTLGVTPEVEFIGLGPSPSPSPSASPSPAALIAQQILRKQLLQQEQSRPPLPVVTPTPLPIVSSTFGPPVFVNSKDSTVLANIREETIKRQIFELQRELHDLQIHSK